MQTLSNEEIVAIAQAQIDPDQLARHQKPLAKTEARLAQRATPQEQLTPRERQELFALRQAAAHLMPPKNDEMWDFLRLNDALSISSAQLFSLPARPSQRVSTIDLHR